MSRKHYIQMADTIKCALALYPDSKPALKTVANELVIVFKQDNRAFNRATFLDACGLGDSNGN